MDIDGGVNMSPKESKFVMVDTLFAKDFMPKIGPLAFGIYVVLKSYMNGESRKAYPTYETLAKRCGCDKRQVIRSIKLLEFHNLVKISRSHRKANVYYMPKYTWWETTDVLPDYVAMRCPEHDAPVVMRNHLFVCPVCRMDVGKYCEDVLKYHFPEITKRDVYGNNKPEKQHSFHDDIPDSYYERILTEGEKYEDNPYPLYDCYVDFDDPNAKPILTPRESISFVFRRKS